MGDAEVLCQTAAYSVEEAVHRGVGGVDTDAGADTTYHSALLHGLTLDGLQSVEEQWMVGDNQIYLFGYCLIHNSIRHIST